MSHRSRHTPGQIFGEAIWWTLIVWLVFLVGFGMFLNYRNLNSSGLIPLLQTVGTGVMLVIKSYLPFSICLAAATGFVIAKQRCP